MFWAQIKVKWWPLNILWGLLVYLFICFLTTITSIHICYKKKYNIQISQRLFFNYPLKVSLIFKDDFCGVCLLCNTDIVLSTVYTSLNQFFSIKKNLFIQISKYYTIFFFYLGIYFLRVRLRLIVFFVEFKLLSNLIKIQVSYLLLLAIRIYLFFLFW